MKRKLTKGTTFESACEAKVKEIHASTPKSQNLLSHIRLQANKRKGSVGGASPIREKQCNRFMNQYAENTSPKHPEDFSTPLDSAHQVMASKRGEAIRKLAIYRGKRPPRLVPKKLKINGT